MVPVYALLLFGGRLAVQHEEGTLTLDGWAKFRAPAKIGTLVRCSSATFCSSSQV